MIDSYILFLQVINDNYPTFKWVALLVELFIIVSITVSYLTIGAVLHHTCKYYGMELFIVVIKT